MCESLPKRPQKKKVKCLIKTTTTKILAIKRLIFKNGGHYVFLSCNYGGITFTKMLEKVYDRTVSYTFSFTLCHC